MLISDEKQPPPATDERVRRSERSKAAIVHALFELIGEGVTGHIEFKGPVCATSHAT